ncbi:hypothetical protein [Salinigranum sp. GCM10025319]|uniref:hypothetical protein n=1 Tax=Salinigranum sp. GCM10025319 TaxID=3252687 RepID=UPI003616D5F9
MGQVKVDSVLWRFITRGDFKSINGLHATGDGGSAKHIPLTSKDVVADFFNFTPQAGADRVINHSIDVVGVDGIPDSGEPIPLACKLDRRGGEWRIPDQHKNRYELWRPQWGFPDTNEISWRDDDDYYDEAPPIIYFIRDTDGRFHARAVPDTTQGTLNDYPSQLASAWKKSREQRNRGNFGIVDFSTDAQISI